MRQKRDAMGNYVDPYAFLPRATGIARQYGRSEDSLPKRAEKVPKIAPMPTILITVEARKEHKRGQNVDKPVDNVDAVDVSTVSTVDAAEARREYKREWMRKARAAKAAKESAP